MLADIGAEGMTLERSCGVAVRLLDLGYFRIGNDVYTDTNGSFGLTTLRKDHVSKHGDALRFHFVGKSGVEHTIDIDDKAAIEALEVMRRRRGGGDELLAWKDGSSGATSAQRRQRLHPRVLRHRGDRQGLPTWHATVIAAAALAETDEPGETKASRKRAVSAR